MKVKILVKLYPKVNNTYTNVLLVGINLPNHRLSKLRLSLPKNIIIFQPFGKFIEFSGNLKSSLYFIGWLLENCLKVETVD